MGISFCIDFLTASVTMLINLGIGISPTMYSLNNINPITTILVFCKIRIYVLQASSMMYRWALVVASFDRYATSSGSARVRDIARVYIARRVIILIVGIWLVFPIHAPILYQLRAGGGACGIFNNQAGALYHSIFTTIWGCILPGSLMTIFSVLIYRNLIFKRKRVDEHLSQQSGNKTEAKRIQQRRDQQVLVMLLIQVFVYLISITPLMIMNLYNASTISVSSKSPDRISIENFIFFLVEVIVYSFPVSSFYLYTMVSKIFREELKRLLYSMVTCKWQRSPRIEPTKLRTVAPS